MVKEPNQGLFVISLDFELVWGVFDKIDLEQKQEYFKNTRNAIPEILNLFNHYNIACTWAIVGMLFNENFEMWKTNSPSPAPTYNKNNLSAYNYGNAHSNVKNENLFFAKALINQIKETPNQEIGTHTYSHYYCLEEGQTLEMFKADLQMAIDIAKKNDVDLKSLVFPRNQFNEDYLAVCQELGIKNVRSNPKDWYWKNVQGNSLKDKIFRTGDAYLGEKNKSYSINSLSYNDSEPLKQPTSRFLRPRTNKKLLNKLRLNRILSEMTKAAKDKEIYHLWWHPHNFGNFPNESLKDLKKILIHYDKCNAKYGFASATMEDVRKQLNSTTSSI